MRYPYLPLPRVLQLEYHIPCFHSQFITMHLHVFCPTSVVFCPFQFHRVRFEERDNWSEACKAEHDAMISNKVYDSLGIWLGWSADKKTKILPSKWILTIKRNANGEISKYKARIVAGGHLILSDPAAYLFADGTYVSVCSPDLCICLLTGLTYLFAGGTYV